MYRKVSTDMNFVDREKAVLDFWKKEGIIEKSFHHRDGAERFTFFLFQKPDPDFGAYSPRRQNHPGQFGGNQRLQAAEDDAEGMSRHPEHHPDRLW